MSDSIYSKGFFDNPDIGYLHKAALIGVLTHGTTDFYTKGSEQTVLSIYFGPNRNTVSSITVTIDNNASMGKSNARASVKSINIGKEFVDFFNGILDSKYTDSEVIQKIIQNRPFIDSWNTQGFVDEWNRLIEPKFRKLFDALKKACPNNNINDSLVNTLRDKYLEAIENSKKKQPITSDSSDEKVVAN